MTSEIFAKPTPHISPLGANLNLNLYPAHEFLRTREPGLYHTVPYLTSLSLAPSFDLRFVGPEVGIEPTTLARQWTWPSPLRHQDSGESET